MKQFAIIFLSIVSFFFEANSQSRWIQHYMDNKNAPAMDLDVAYDNGYLLSGWITPNYPPYCWLIKTDINGDLSWQKMVGGINGSSVCVYNSSQNFTGDLFFFGCIIYAEDANPMIIKLNACGEKEWCRELITTSKNDFFYGGIFTIDGGCSALVFDAFTPAYNRAGILRFSAEGDLLWQQYYQSEDPGVFAATLSDLINTPDQGFLMTGWCYYPDPNNSNIYWLHPYYIKTDSLGNFEWETIVHKETGDVGGEAFMSLVNPSQSFIYSCISHYYTSDTLVSTRPAIVKLDLQGNVVGVYDLVHGIYDLGKLMTFDFLNDSIMTGSASWRDEEDDPQSRVVVFDTLGQIKDSLTIINDYFLGLTKTTFDNKILIFVSDHSSGQFDPYLFKLTEDLEQDTFYTTPFVYDSLCPYQIASDTIVPDDCGVIVGIEEQGDGEEETGGQGEEGKGGMEIFPNPAQGIVDCRWSNFDFRGDFSLVIYDMFGREMMNISVPENEREIQFEVGIYIPGLYLVVLKDESNIIGSSKLVISR